MKIRTRVLGGCIRHGTSTLRICADTCACSLARIPTVAGPGGGLIPKLRHVQRVRARRVRLSLPHARAADPCTTPRHPPTSWAGRAGGVCGAERSACSNPARQGGGADLAILCCQYRLNRMASNSCISCAGCARRRCEPRASAWQSFPTWHPPPPGRARQFGALPLHRMPPSFFQTAERHYAYKERRA